ncbi:MAG: Rrf2 family transcriptional regulator [candidate division Zixibacteria bacterium]|jgi:Rrf2 family protein|nr:Rrf2 family transcriptional regulator [candidate division Zixibacteria bacterium]
MRFTKAEDYGLYGVLYLAEQEDNRIVPLSEISQSQNVPEKFLAKIFQSLSRAGIIKSHRGVKGGFTLARSPEEISVRELVETIQGPYFLSKCVHDHRECDKSDHCPVRYLLHLTLKCIHDQFDKYTLADMLKWKSDPNITSEINSN